MFKGHVASGTVEGTGAAINISCGFTPSHVRVVNFDDPTTMEWFAGMGAAAGVKLTDAPALTKITSNGISTYAGSDTPGSEAGKGFTIGADTDLNVDGETLFWFATGDD